jgi:hypothetical protein
LAKQVVISGLSIETPENMALKEFSISYAERSVQYPKKMIIMPQLFRSNAQVKYFDSGSKHF